MSEDWRNVFGNNDDEIDEVPKQKTNNYNKPFDKNEQFKLSSGLFKSCRIGDIDNALRYGEKLSRLTNPFYVMRVLTKLIGEDCCPMEFIKLAPAIRTMYNAAKDDDLRGHDLWQSIFIVANAKKWYQTKEGIQLEKMRQVLHKGNSIIESRDESWLYDYHTREGQRRIREGTADLRLDGRWENRFNVMRRWQKVYEANDCDYEKARKEWVNGHYSEKNKLDF